MTMRYCLHCCAPLIRRMNEDSRDFQRRQTCNKSCAGKVREAGAVVLAPVEQSDTPPDFSAHNLTFAPLVARLPGQEPRVSLQGCGTAMAAAERSAI